MFYWIVNKVFLVFLISIWIRLFFCVKVNFLEFINIYKLEYYYNVYIVCIIMYVLKN